MNKLQKIQACQNCKLCLNQKPLLDKPKKADVFWLGLSAVKVADIKKDVPLSSNTNSGKLISHIEENNDSVSFYKTNLVKCLPLNGDKIRYPKTQEMESCFENLQLEIKQSKPRIVFLLGKLVSDFIMNIEHAINPSLDEEFNYQSHIINNIHYVPIHHPSYILVYKRKFLQNYMSKISNMAINLANC